MAGAYPSFNSMKQLGELLLSPLDGLSPAVYRQYPFIHLGEETVEYSVE